MQLNVMSDDGSTLQIQAIGQMHLVDFGAAAAPVNSLLESSGYARKVLMDLSQVTYIDSSCVAWLLTCHKRCREAGGELILHSVPPSILAILKMLRLETLLNLAEDARSAEALARGGQS